MRTITAKLLIISIISLSFLVWAGCSKRYHNLPAFSAFPVYDTANGSVGRFKTSYLADQIHAYYRGYTNGPIAIATFVDIDNLYGSSTFGRYMTENLMSELSMRGYNVVELRQAEALQVMFGQGEFGLSREVGTLSDSPEISGLIVGTYAVSPVRVYVNARLVDPSSSLVLSAGSVEMERTREISRMIRTASLPPTLERIPVRHLGYASPFPYNYGAPARPQLFDEEDLLAPNAEGKGDTTDLPSPAGPDLPPPATLEQGS